MKCPRDETGLVPARKPVGLLYCPKCRGMWVRAASFRDLLRWMDTGRGYAGGSPVPDVRGRRNPPVPCPVWHADVADVPNVMTQKEYHGIQVDICREHGGFWLDGGEYDELLRVYRAKRVSTADRARLRGAASERGWDAALDAPLGPAAGELGGELAGALVEAVLCFIIEVIADAF